MRMEFLWLALIVVFAVIEGATTALTTVWFIGGALAALAAALPHERRREHRPRGHRHGGHRQSA